MLKIEYFLQSYENKANHLLIFIPLLQNEDDDVAPILTYHLSSLVRFTLLPFTGLH